MSLYPKSDLLVIPSTNKIKEFYEKYNKLVENNFNTETDMFKKHQVSVLDAPEFQSEHLVYINTPEGISIPSTLNDGYMTFNLGVDYTYIHEVKKYYMIGGDYSIIFYLVLYEYNNETHLFVKYDGLNGDTLDFYNGEHSEVITTNQILQEKTSQNSHIYCYYDSGSQSLGFYVTATNYITGAPGTKYHWTAKFLFNFITPSITTVMSTLGNSTTETIQSYDVTYDMDNDYAIITSIYGVNPYDTTVSIAYVASDAIPYPLSLNTGSLTINSATNFRQMYITTSGSNMWYITGTSGVDNLNVGYFTLSGTGSSVTVNNTDVSVIQAISLTDTDYISHQIDIIRQVFVLFRASPNKNGDNTFMQSLDLNTGVLLSQWNIPIQKDNNDDILNDEVFNLSDVAYITNDYIVMRKNDDYLCVMPLNVNMALGNITERKQFLINLPKNTEFANENNMFDGMLVKESGTDSIIIKPLFTSSNIILNNAFILKSYANEGAVKSFYLLESHLSGELKLVEDAGGATKTELTGYYGEYVILGYYDKDSGVYRYLNER